MAAGATGGCGAAGDTGCACAGSGACPCALTAATSGAGCWVAGRGSVAVDRGASSDRFGSRYRTGALSRLAGARASAKGDGTSRFWVAGAAPWAWGTAAWAALPAPTACGPPGPAEASSWIASGCGARAGRPTGAAARGATATPAGGVFRGAETAAGEEPGTATGVRFWAKFAGRDFFDLPPLSTFLPVSKPFAEGDEVATVPGW